MVIVAVGRMAVPVLRLLSNWQLVLPCRNWCLFSFLAMFPFDASDFVFSLMMCLLLCDVVLSFEGFGWNCF